MNKIDLPSAEPEVVKDQIVDLIDCDRSDILSVMLKRERSSANLEEIKESCSAKRRH